jgi:hypothetical protein
MTVGWLKREVMAGPITYEYWLGEVDELIVELRAGNLTGIREEWSDVTCLLLLHLSDRFRFLEFLPILPGLGLYAARKFEARQAVWERIFAHHNVKFDKAFLIGGGNFAKLRKVKAALRNGGCQEADEGWLWDQGIVKEP